jgi:hypothetical protein
MSEVVDICSPRVGQYMGVFVDKTREILDGKITLRFVAYRAYNAMGLIGSEFNGIAILDETNKSVLTDNLMKQTSGYNMPEKAIEAEIDRMIEMSEDDLRDIIIESDRYRG